VTTSASTRRALAVAAADGTCPRCGTSRASDQRYCLGCGFVLPIVTGRVASLRRAWIGRIGWYPGDWVWGTVLALVVAAAATAAAVVVASRHHARGVSFTSVPAGVALREPATQTTGAGGAPAGSRVDTATLPTPPEPGSTAAAGQNGRVAWPSGETGWTIVLVSYPKTFGHPQALATASRAAKKGLSEVGVIDSSRYASLQPGYYVVFTGVYASKADADAAVTTARQAGFAGAYSRAIVG
jgi:hypothetical protein